MAVVYAPGIGQSVLSGMIGSNPWAVVHHWQFGTSALPWTQHDADLLCSTEFSAWQTALMAHVGNNIDIRKVTFVDLTNSTGVSSEFDHTPVNGTIGGPLEPSSACVVVQNRIAARYRGGHPRTFWPALMQGSMLNEYQWINANALQIQTGAAAFVSAIVSAAYTGGTGPLQHVIPRWTYTITDVPAKHKYLRTRSGYIRSDVVQGYLANQKIGSQRRRLSP